MLNVFVQGQWAEVLGSDLVPAGVIVAARLAMSALRKPFDTYNFQEEISAVAATYLQLHPADSEENPVSMQVASSWLLS